MHVDAQDGLQVAKNRPIDARSRGAHKRRSPVGAPVTLARRSRFSVITVVAALAFAGCNSSRTGGSRIESLAAKCTDGFLRTVNPRIRATRAAVRHYVSVTYCERFARNGWVYSDGALSIDAQRWLVRGGREKCAKASPTGNTETIPCKELPQGEPRVIVCGILHHVRRSEVRTYLRVREGHGVKCDDGTPLGALGVP
jgi:hypothetical protein